jgi:transposase-like protein/IS1 family transposase
MNCHCCQSEQVKKSGRFQNKNRLVQRYQCLRCGKTFSESQPLDGVRIEKDKAVQVVNLLVEGVGIRSIARLTGLHQETVLNVLKTAGEQCQQVLDERIRNVQVEAIQVDEIWCFCGCKERQNTTGNYERGDQYLFHAVESKSKLIISHNIGKRDSGQTLTLIDDLGKRVTSRFQLTTDGFEAYKTVVPQVLGGRVDFAQLIKIYSATPNLPGPERRYSPGVCTGARRIMRCGTPDLTRVSTSYIERANLSIRLFNRRFTRLTLGFSKKIDYLKASIALLICHFNFCRVHSAHGLTPAQAAGITDHAWTIGELLNYGSNYNAR